MSAAEIINQLHQHGADLTIVGGKLKCRFPKGAIDPGLLTIARSHKVEIMALLAGSLATQLREAIETACRSLPISPSTVVEHLAPEDIEGLESGEIPEDALQAFALATYERLCREKGERPSTYTQVGECVRCGSVWLPEGWITPARNCPWCFNRHRGLKIPSLDAAVAIQRSDSHAVDTETVGK